MTRILIDGYALSDGSQLRGIGTYLKRIIGGLAERPGTSVAVLADAAAALPDGVGRISLGGRAPARFRHLEHDLLLARRLRGADADVFHSPAQEPPRRSALPWVQTLHDLTPLTRPDPLLSGDARRWRRIGPRLREAAAVVAVSRFSADEAIRRLGLDPAVITVIPHGVDHDVFKPGPAADSPEPYVLHVAAWGPHKGFAEAGEVVARLAESGLPHRLVLAGPGDDWTEARVREIAAAAARSDRIEPAGYVADLPGLYRGAAVVLMTSRCEGFGFPVLEAMACGTPVVAFDNSSIPEVVGDAGILIPDGDTPAMAAAVERVIREPAMREELVQRGLEQASGFRWQDAIEAYGELFESIA